jgi:hypothetical protein
MTGPAVAVPTHKRPATAEISIARIIIILTLRSFSLAWAEPTPDPSPVACRFAARRTGRGAQTVYFRATPLDAASFALSSTTPTAR